MTPSETTDTPDRPDVMEAGANAMTDPAAPLPINEAKWVRAQERFAPDGKAIAEPERSEMYENTEGAGDGGTLPGTTGAENQNPIGRRT